VSAGIAKLMELSYRDASGAPAPLVTAEEVSAFDRKGPTGEERAARSIA
jgi:hypothetical protein